MVLYMNLNNASGTLEHNSIRATSIERDTFPVFTYQEMYSIFNSISKVKFYWVGLKVIFKGLRVNMELQTVFIANSSVVEGVSNQRIKNIHTQRTVMPGIDYQVI